MTNDGSTNKTRAVFSSYNLFVVIRECFKRPSVASEPSEVESSHADGAARIQKPRTTGTRLGIVGLPTARINRMILRD
jgi:hypothetical protein